MTRLVIAGVPKAGKTTASMAICGVATTADLTRTPAGLSGRFGPGAYVRHTDDLIGASLGHGPLSWSGVSEVVATWFDATGPWIVEGVAAVRALRKWLAAHPTGAPCDRVLWLDTPRVALTAGQRRMAAGCRTVWREIEPSLLARGVHVERA